MHYKNNNKMEYGSVIKQEQFISILNHMFQCGSSILNYFPILPGSVIVLYKNQVMSYDDKRGEFKNTNFIPESKINYAIGLIDITFAYEVNTNDIFIRYIIDYGQKSYKPYKRIIRGILNEV